MQNKKRSADEAELGEGGESKKVRSAGPEVIVLDDEDGEVITID